MSKLDRLLSDVNHDRASKKGTDKTVKGKSKEDDDSVISRGAGDQSFQEEFSESLIIPVQKNEQTYAQSGVSFRKINDTEASITYTGLLAKNGASELYGIIGSGSNQRWENVATIPLKQKPDHTFEAIVPITQEKNLNIVFKDCSENYDNNSGLNYTFVN